MHGKAPHGRDAQQSTAVVVVVPQFGLGLKSLMPHWHRNPLGEFGAFRHGILPHGRVEQRSNVVMVVVVPQFGFGLKSLFPHWQR